jgi:hypothetical protein
MVEELVMATKKFSDDKIDVIAILVIMTAIVTGVVYWLNSMPS